MPELTIEEQREFAVLRAIYLAGFKPHASHSIYFNAAPTMARYGGLVDLRRWAHLHRRRDA